MQFKDEQLYMITVPWFYIKAVIYTEDKIKEEVHISREKIN